MSIWYKIELVLFAKILLKYCKQYARCQRQEFIEFSMNRNGDTNNAYMESIWCVSD